MGHVFWLEGIHVSFQNCHLEQAVGWSPQSGSKGLLWQSVADSGEDPRRTESGWVPSTSGWCFILYYNHSGVEIPSTLPLSLNGGWPLQGWLSISQQGALFVHWSSSFPQHPTLSDMTQYELNFSLLVEQMHSKIVDPAYRQVIVEVMNSAVYALLRQQLIVSVCNQPLDCSFLPFHCHGCRDDALKQPTMCIVQFQKQKKCWFSLEPKFFPV